jgi:glycosyltransferase involved in cell wall biosynthesis
MDNYNSSALDCSVIAPLYNETDVVEELYERLTAVMRGTGLRYELIFIDDGSRDNTLEKIKTIAARDSHVTTVELRRNFVSMDGDLQHLPEEIPAFLSKINEGYDVVSGWRKQRVDNLFLRKIPSRIANRIASKISGVDIHDFGTTFKAYRKEVVDELELYGEMHRFIPAIVSGKGARIVEIPITNIVRPKGKSNYGISRTFRVIFDLMTLRFVLGYASKPLHFFGKMALYCFTASLAMAMYILYDKIAYHVPILAAHAPLAGLAAILFLVGFILTSTGLIGEMICRVYFEATGAKIYSIRKIHRKKSAAEGIK